MSNNMFLINTITLMVSYFLFTQYNDLNTFTFAYAYNQLPTLNVFNKAAKIINIVFSNFEDILEKGTEYFGESRVEGLSDEVEAEIDIISDSSEIISDPKDFVKRISSVKLTSFGYIKYTLHGAGFSYYVCNSSGISRYDEHHIQFSTFNSKMKSGKTVKFNDKKLGTRSFIHIEYKAKDFLFKKDNCVAIIPSSNSTGDKLYVLASDENEDRVFIDVKTKQAIREIDMLNNDKALFYRFISRTASQERKATATFVLVKDYNNYKEELTTILDAGSQGEFSNMVNHFKTNPNISDEQKMLNVLGNIATVGKNLGRFNNVAVVDGKITLYYEVTNNDGITTLKEFTPFDGQGIVRASSLANVVTEGLQQLGHNVIVLPQAVKGLSIQARLHTDKGVLNVVSDKTFTAIFNILKEDYNFITYGYNDVNVLPDVIMDRNQVKWLPMNKDCNWLLYVLSISKLSVGNSSVQGVFDTLMEADTYRVLNGTSEQGFENMTHYNDGLSLIKEAIEEKLDSMMNPAPISQSALFNRPVSDVLMSIDNNTFNELPQVRSSAIRRATNKIFNKYINKLSVPIDTYNLMLQCDWTALLISEKIDDKRVVRNVLKYNEALCLLNSKEAVCVKYPKVAGEHHLISIITSDEYMKRVKALNLSVDVFDAIEDMYTDVWEGNIVVPANELLCVKESGADFDGDKFSVVIDPMIVDVYKQIDALGHSYIIMKDLEDDDVIEDDIII